ncbi:GspE/PulE family protein [Desulfatiglans anilini]|uniref:GspE/PulE family protein n=1 Tax=Desulfatiglans anilini TaxID=90728 RepID=UPI00040FB0CB|nr:GspE/PulE family protein [Desulfatiglans anilini]
MVTSEEENRLRSGSAERDARSDDGFDSRFAGLLGTGLLSLLDLKDAESRARSAGRSVESILLDEFHLSKQDLGLALARCYRMPYLAFSEELHFPAGRLSGVKTAFLRKNGMIPVWKNPEKSAVLVAMRDPADLQARDAVRRIFPGEPLSFAVALDEDIQRLIDQLERRRRDGAAVDAPGIEALLQGLEPAPGEPEEEREEPSEQDSLIVQLVNRMILDACRQRASDIHIEPRSGKAGTLVRFRVDGVCRVYQTIPASYQRAVVSRIKIMADMDISERRLPQDGKILFKRFGSLDIELRVVTVPLGGLIEDVVLRILPRHAVQSIQKIEMSARDETRFKELISKPYGLVLVVGPTGSGKTTTLHAALAEINRTERKIWTAEDPVEITQDGLRQVQINRRIGYDFAAALRSFLRADPDVIMVGEMRDRETAAIAIEASLTGHLVLSTLHTNSAAETVVRLLEMGLDPCNFADALLGVLAQRLVRSLCRRCRRPCGPDPGYHDALEASYGDGWSGLGESSQSMDLFTRGGCPHCNQSGYSGRTAICELLLCTDPIKELIRRGAPVDALNAQAAREGMTTLMQNGVRKVVKGITDLQEVRRVCLR